MSIAGHRPMHPDLVGQIVLCLAVFLSMSAKMCCKTSSDNEKNSALSLIEHLLSISNTTLASAALSLICL